MRVRCQNFFQHPTGWGGTAATRLAGTSRIEISFDGFGGLLGLWKRDTEVRLRCQNWFSGGRNAAHWLRCHLFEISFDNFARFFWVLLCISNAISGSLKDQIAEVQCNMSQFKLNFEKEQNEFREERNNYRLEVHSLSQQFGEDKSKFDQMFKDLVGGFEREREVFREEIKTLLQRVADLRNSVQNVEVTSNNRSVFYLFGTFTFLIFTV